MGDLSTNFSRWEFACPCCGWDDVQPVLLKALERLRALCGHVTVTINSGCRCALRNRIVGGSDHSQHLHGRAADIVVPALPPLRVALLAEQIPVFSNGGIGIYDGRIHVDTRPQRSRWGFVNGEKTTFENAVRVLP